MFAASLVPSSCDIGLCGTGSKQARRGGGRSCSARPFVRYTVRNGRLDRLKPVLRKQRADRQAEACPSWKCSGTASMTTTASVDLQAIGRRAKEAARRLAVLGTEVKNRALLAMADALTAHQDEILRANQHDMQAAHEGGL